MKINFCRSTSANKKPIILDKLVREFAAEYDIVWGNNLKGYMQTPAGARSLAEWAKNAGYIISYWELQACDDELDDEEDEPIKWFAFGIDIDESCPKIVELKLKSQ